MSAKCDCNAITTQWREQRSICNFMTSRSTSVYSTRLSNSYGPDSWRPAPITSIAASRHFHHSSREVSMSSEKSKDVSNTQTTEIEDQSLPKLSPQDHKIYNRLSERMDMFHEHFRQTWTTLFTACSTGRRPSGMSIRQFLSLGDSFCRMLEMHHGIEEQHIFPLLARKMPQFQKSHELLTQHVVIHKGLDELDAYLVACKTGERELRLEEMKGVMDGFGTVLWEHMDDEVRALSAENMSQFWTREEMARLPI